MTDDRPLVSEATALPTEPQPLPHDCKLLLKQCNVVNF